MAEPIQLVFNDAPGDAPASYVFPPGLSATLQSVSATFDGAGASGAFYACLSVYSQNDKLIGRFFPERVIPAGDDADVTFGAFLGGGDGAGPQVGQWAYLRGTVDLPNGANQQTAVVFTTITESDSSLYSLDTGDLYIAYPGQYIMFAGLATSSASASFVSLLLGAYGGTGINMDMSRPLQRAVAFTPIQTQAYTVEPFVFGQGDGYPKQLQWQTLSTTTGAIAGVPVSLLIYCVGDVLKKAT